MAFGRSVSKCFLVFSAKTEGESSKWYGCIWGSGTIDTCLFDTLLMVGMVCDAVLVATEVVLAKNDTWVSTSLNDDNGNK
jgi:hypothetical protein